VQKLHAVLQPRVAKPVRSTKPLTLPDDIELETDKRLASRAAAGAAGQEQVRVLCSLAGFHQLRYGAGAGSTSAVLFQAQLCQFLWCVLTCIAAGT
jgi:hypothetical protein